MTKRVDSREWGQFALIISVMTAICTFWLGLGWYLILSALALGAWVKWSRP